MLRATGGKADGAHRWPALSRAAQSLERELGATPALPGQQAVRQPGKEVESKFRAGCARLPAVPGGSRGDRSKQFGALGGFPAPRPTGSWRGPGPSNRLKVDARPRLRQPLRPAPCGRWGRSHAVAVATGSVCAPGCRLARPWPLRSSSRSRSHAGRSPQLVALRCCRSRRCR